MAAIICKIVSEDNEIRRFTCSVETVTYTSIHKRAKQMLGIETPFRLQYKDDEGDIITMSTDDEMAEAVGLALSCTPAVLRLTIKPEKPTEKTSTAKAPAATAQAPAPPKQPDASGTPDLTSLLNDIQQKLPAMMSQLPAAVRNLVPHATLDVAATMAATAAANATATSAAGCGYGDANVHPGVACDKTGMCPIVGNRYNLTGHNYDLCEAEYLKLPADEQAKFKKISPPFGTASKGNPCGGAGFQGCPLPMERHWGVTCDKSGMSPIMGNRYHLIGHNYDLCEAEYQKLPAEEQAKFERISAPFQNHWGGPWGKCGGWRNRHAAPHHHSPHHAPHHQKLAGRFVCDVAVFDGTQVAPSTPFTKIWRIKNVGDVPWPPGTKMLFVGGDMMSAEMTVPLTSRVVLPGEEVDVAVDMVAPAEVGRYVGYWRLMAKDGKRFGQKVWCHIQVVDPNANNNDDFVKASEEVATMMAKVTHEDEGEEVEAAAPEEAELPPAAAPSAEPPTAENMETEEAAPEQPAAAEAGPSTSCASSVVSVSDEDAKKAGLATELLSMGFTDQEMVEHVIDKNNGDLEQCARDLVALNEWDTLLGDLEDMGFENKALNKKLMVKHNGSVKRTVKDLVADIDA